MSKEDYKLYTEASRMIRGEIIERAIRIERYIDIYIASHFCKKPSLKFELTTLFLGTKYSSAENKKMVFFHLLSNHNKTYYKKHQKDFSKISSVYLHRNNWAHNSLVANEGSLSAYNKHKTITLTNLKNTKHTQRITITEYMSIIKKASECAIIIRNLLIKRKYLPLYEHSNMRS